MSGEALYRKDTDDSVRERIVRQVRSARDAAHVWAQLTRADKDAALEAVAQQIQRDAQAILTANVEDLAEAKSAGHPPAYLDRLALSPERLASLAESVQALTALPDPVGEVTASWTREDGLMIRQVRVPLGVIAMIYEARPNVTVDAAAIALKTGNGIVLRGSRSARRSNLALAESMRTAVASRGLPPDAIQYLADGHRDAVDVLCTLNGLLDVIIPRGGADLINRVLSTATVPVIETGVGNCHVFIDRSAAYDMAEAIVVNAKTSRPAVCNAAETLLLHSEWPAEHAAALLKRLAAAGVELRVCGRTQELHPGLAEISTATDDDWDTEFLNLTLAVRTVDSLDEALAHIARHGTRHSEAIVTEDDEAARRFLAEVDAAAVYHNASTRFTDGGEFGFGAEIGISTQKLHARGPMGLTALTSTKYQIIGSGHIRS